MIDVADKAKGALLSKELKCIDSKGELVSISISTIFLKGLGGFGDKGTYKLQYMKKPTRKPDLIVEEKTRKNSAFLYRLNGDTNLLHIDPDMAKLGGY